jgi:hypothetical protein
VKLVGVMMMGTGKVKANHFKKNPRKYEEGDGKMDARREEGEGSGFQLEKG